MGFRKLKSWLSLFLILVTVLAVTVPGTVSLAADADGNGLGRYIVLFEHEVNAAAKDALTNKFGGVVEKNIALLGNANVVLLPPKAVQAFAANANVLRVEEDAIVYAIGKPTNNGKPGNSPPPPETLPWGVDRIDAERTWGASTGAGVKVAVIDTGIDKDHPDIAGNIKGGQNFVAIRGRVKPDQWDDDNGHGTHVAGTIAAVNNNGIGVIGVAPEAWLYAVKVLNRNGSGYTSDVILGISWAIDNQVDVINMSLGSSSDVQSMHDAVDAAYAKGIVVVAAAGNSGDGDPDNDVIYPARYSSVIAVAATDSNDIRASWSSDGPEVEIAAPGVDIYSTYKGGGYATLSGTSMASPHVAGTVALMLGKNPGLTPLQVRETLQTTADDLPPIGNDNQTGAGLVDAEEAVTGTP